MNISTNMIKRLLDHGDITIEINKKGGEEKKVISDELHYEVTFRVEGGRQKAETTHTHYPQYEKYCDDEGFFQLIMSGIVNVAVTTDWSQDE